jgi:hypothetical protein
MVEVACGQIRRVSQMSIEQPATRSNDDHGIAEDIASGDNEGIVMECTLSAVWACLSRNWPLVRTLSCSPLRCFRRKVSLSTAITTSTHPPLNLTHPHHHSSWLNTSRSRRLSPSSRRRRSATSPRHRTTYVWAAYLEHRGDAIAN